MSFLKQKYRKYRAKIRLYSQINWIKTWYINLKFLPLKDALKLPIIVFGQCSFGSLSGKIIFDVPIETGIITLGHRFEIFKKSARSAEIFIQGVWQINGYAQIGYDYKIYIEKNAVLQTGDMFTMANNGKIVCTNKIILGDHVKIGDESQLIDTNFHDLYDVNKQKNIPKKGEIHLGSYIGAGNRVTYMKNTKIPDYSLITSNSLCNKDFSEYANNNIFGGIPAKHIKENIIRNWQAEEKAIKEYLTIKL